jgi:Ni/Co efflux regulator RcnB
VKTRSWIGKITLLAVAVVAIVPGMLLAAAPASAAQAISIERTTMHGDHMKHSDEHHRVDRDHDRRHHFYGRPNGTYFIYPYSYSWTYRYPAPTYRVPTYWYYCPSYGAYYPYVSSCSESWVPVPAS